MGKVEKFEDLDVWKGAKKLCQKIYDITNREPFSKDYRFKDQIRSSSGSIMDNIAEGFERGGNKEFIQFLYIAKGSCGEARSQLHRASDFGYINDEEYKDLINGSVQLSKKISSFISYLKNSQLKGEKYSNTQTH